MPDLNEKLVMLFYIKCRLVSLQYKSIIFISSSVTNVIHLMDNINTNEVLRTNFLNIFIDCMLRNRNKAYLHLQTSSSQKLINIAFNWLIEFMETTTRNSTYYFSSNKKIEFILDIFTCFICAWSNQWLINESDNDDIIDYSLELKQQMINKLDIYLKKLSKLTYWKQIQSKLIDWLILVSNFKSIINIDTYSIIKSALIELFLIQDNNLNSDTWFKYAEFMSK